MGEFENLTETGTVKWFSPRKGFGFIIRDSVSEDEENHEIFVHYSNIVMEGFKTLLPNLRVSFEVKEGQKPGTIEATNVKIIPQRVKKEEDTESKQEEKTEGEE